MDGLTYPEAIGLLASVTFLVDCRSKEEYLVASDAGMAKLMADYHERTNEDMAADLIRTGKAN